MTTDKIIAFAIAGFLGWSALSKDVVEKDATQTVSVSALSSKMESQDAIILARLTAMEASQARVENKLLLPRFTDITFANEMRPRDADIERNSKAIVTQRGSIDALREKSRDHDHEIKELRRRLSDLESASRD